MNHSVEGLILSHFTDVGIEPPRDKGPVHSQAAGKGSRAGSHPSLLHPHPASPYKPTWVWMWHATASWVHAATRHLLQPRHIHSCEPRQGLQVPREVVITGGRQEPAGRSRELGREGELQAAPWDPLDFWKCSLTPHHPKPLWSSSLPFSGLGVDTRPLGHPLAAEGIASNRSFIHPHPAAKVINTDVPSTCAVCPRHWSGPSRC